MDYMLKLYYCNTLCLVISIRCHVHGDMKYRVAVNNIWLYHMSTGFMLWLEVMNTMMFKLWRVGFV